MFFMLPIAFPIAFLGTAAGTIAAIAAVAAAVTGGVAVSKSNVAGKAAKSKQEQALRLQSEQFKAQEKRASDLEARITAEGEEASRLGLSAKKSAEEESRKRRRRRSNTILTSPRGALEPATTSKKTLLGT